MKTSTVNQSDRTPRQGQQHKPMPEIRDNLDSRKNEEWIDKADGVTHPEKEKKSERKRVKHGK